MDIFINKVSTLPQEKLNLVYNLGGETLEKEVVLSTLSAEDKQIIYDFVALSSNQKIVIESVTADIVVNVFIKTVTIVPVDLVLPNRLTHASPIQYEKAINLLANLILE